MRLRWVFAQMMIAFIASQVMDLAPAHSRNFGVPKEGLQNETPKELENVGITENLGSKVDLGLPFRNEAGESVTLGSYFNDHRPVLLVLAYYTCPSLCNFHLNGLNDTFKQLDEPIGQDFKVVVVSIEPKETPEIAADKKASYLKAYGRPGVDNSWHFLVGDEPAIRQLAKQVGFGYEWNEEQQQWAHAAAAYVITPAGTISRYLYGIVVDPQTLKLSMVEASNGKVGSVVDKLILFCFHFDPKASKYTLYAFNVMRAGGVLTVGVLAMFLTPFWIRSRREQRGGEGRRSGPNNANRANGLQGEA